MLSHTIEADLAWLTSEETLLRLRYRFYTQSAASHYRKHLLQPIEDLPRYYTHDKELSTLSAHRIALDFEHKFVFDDDGNALRLVASVGPTFYGYVDFVPASSITAFEATLSLVLEL